MPRNIVRKASARMWFREGHAHAHTRTRWRDVSTLTTCTSTVHMCVLMLMCLIDKRTMYVKYRLDRHGTRTRAERERHAMMRAGMPHTHKYAIIACCWPRAYIELCQSSDRIKIDHLLCTQTTQTVIHDMFNCFGTAHCRSVTPVRAHSGHRCIHTHTRQRII